MKRILFFLLTLTLTTLACGQSAHTQIPLQTTPTIAPAFPKGDRILGIDVNYAADGNYDAAFQLAKKVGMEHVGLFLQWSTLETAPGVYDDFLLDAASAYYPDQGIKLDITLAVINTTQREFPADLADKPFDDPVVIERFKQLIDHVFAKTEGIELGPLNIGSEYDVLFGADAKQWQQFGTFYKELVAYVHLEYPDTKVSVEATFKGMTDSARSRVQVLNQYSDIIGVSYYPLADNGDVKDPSVIFTDFDRIVALYPNQPIYFFQIGYPSSEYIQSSEERQAQFIRTAFQAWDVHADHITLLDFTWLHDQSPEMVRGFEEYYGLSSRSFAEFLGSLGLRTYDGKDKLAFTLF